MTTDHRSTGLARILAAAVTALAVLAVAACNATASDATASNATASNATASDAGASTTAGPVATTAGTTGLAPGWRTDSGTFDGIVRTWAIHVPQDLPPGPVPLVVGLHGGLGSAETFRRDTGLDRLAEEEGFIVLFPEAVEGDPVQVGGRSTPERSWNAIGCCGAAARAGTDDIGFVTGLVEQIAATLPVDRSRTYLVGSSNGGMLTAAIACADPGFAAAYVVNAAATMDPACAPDGPVSLLSLHGDADGNVPIGGGQPSAGLQRNIDYPSLQESLAPFLAAGSCGAPSTTEDAEADVTTQRWDCAGTTEVVSMVLHGAGHGWPGAPPSALGQERPTNLDGTEVAWAFLRQIGSPPTSSPPTSNPPTSSPPTSSPPTSSPPTSSPSTSNVVPAATPGGAAPAARTVTVGYSTEDVANIDRAASALGVGTDHLQQFGIAAVRFLTALSGRDAVPEPIAPEWKPTADGPQAVTLVWSDDTAWEALQWAIVHYDVTPAQGQKIGATLMVFLVGLQAGAS